MPDLRIEPQALPRLRAALDDALRRLETPLRDLQADARLPRPWLGDPVSASSASTYAHRATDGPAPALRTLLAYRAELTRMRDGLDAADHGYDSTEQAVAASLRAPR